MPNLLAEACYELALANRIIAHEGVLDGFGHVSMRHPTDPGRFSNRPFGVKRFQTIHHSGVDVARGLVLLFGIGTRALPSWDSRTRRNNLSGGLAVRRTAGPSDRTNSPHPSSREGHHSTVGVELSPSFLLSEFPPLRVSSYRI